jgi:hypothetical protein
MLLDSPFYTESNYPAARAEPSYIRITKTAEWNNQPNIFPARCIQDKCIREFRQPRAIKPGLARLLVEGDREGNIIPGASKPNCGRIQLRIERMFPADV